MKVREIFESMDASPPDSEPSFDIVDDIVVFMRNDSEIYRKIVFPAIVKSNSLQTFKKILLPIMDKISSVYVNRFSVNELEKNARVTKSDHQAIVDELYKQETENNNANS